MAPKKDQIHLETVLKAINYRMTIYDMTKEFKKMKIKAVSEHLTKAYKEIDRIWKNV